MDPTTPDAYCDQALAPHQEGRLDAAEPLYLKALALAPRHARANHLLGVLRHQQGRGEEALALLAAALAQDPDNCEMLSNLGGMLKTAGRAGEALGAYERALALQPAHAGALNGRGAILLDANRYEEALAAYDAALAAAPDFVVALANRGRALQFLGRFDEAHADFERVLALEPERAATYLDYLETATVTPGNRLPARMEALLARPGLPAEAQWHLEFALAKARTDLGEHRAGFLHLLRANALKRAHTAYDEAASAGFFAQVAETFSAPLLRQKEKLGGNLSARPIFIIGMMRSGSTLVEQILASHPDVHGGGELPDFIRSAAGAGMGVPYPDFVPGLDGAALDGIAARYLEAVAGLGPAARRLTDKMPANFFWAGLVHLALPNAVILHTVRDPLDTCVSCFSKLFTEDHPYAYDLAELGRFYRRYAGLMAHWHDVLPPGRILDIRYEEVVADIEGQARRILAHCGLDWNPRCLDFHANRRPVRTASVAQVRAPLYGGAVGRAHRHEEFLGPLMAALGEGG